VVRHEAHDNTEETCGLFRIGLQKEFRSADAARIVTLNDMPAYEIFGKFYDAVMGDRSRPAEHLEKLIRSANPNAKNVLETRMRNRINVEAYAAQLQSVWARYFQQNAFDRAPQSASRKILPAGHGRFLKSTTDST